MEGGAVGHNIERRLPKDLNVIFYQNMSNLHNRYKLAERKISTEKP